MKFKHTFISMLSSFALLLTCAACGNSEAGTQIADESSTPDQVQLVDEIIADDVVVRETSFELTKDQLYYKSLNTILYMDKLSGTTSIKYTADDNSRITGSFQFDYINGLYHSESTVSFLDYEDHVFSETEIFSDSSEMVELYHYPETGEKKYRVFTDGMCPSIDRSYFVDRCPINPEDEDTIAKVQASGEVYYTSIDQIEETELMQTNGSDPTGAGMIAGSFCPKEMTWGFLTNFDNWEITGTKEFQGRHCTVVQGIAEKDYAEQIGAVAFEIWVDTKTGVWMQYEGYDKEGNVVSYVYTENLCFGADAADVPLFSQEKTNGYEIIELSH